MGDLSLYPLIIFNILLNTFFLKAADCIPVIHVPFFAIDGMAGNICQVSLYSGMGFEGVPVTKEIGPDLFFLPSYFLEVECGDESSGSHLGP